MKAGIPEQLALRIGLREGINFDNFLSSGNEAVLHQLKEGDEPFVYLWGSMGSGRSHLLQALCHQSDQAGNSVVYFSLLDYQALDVAMVEGMEHYALVAIDDIDTIAGDPAWEEALFHLYNRVRDAGSRMVAAASAPPSAAGFHLPDLISRLSWGPVYQLQGLDDNGKAAALQLRSRRRGMELSDEVAAYLLKHASRDMTSLFALLDDLDRASLRAKRRLTIPFVRELLSHL